MSGRTRITGSSVKADSLRGENVMEESLLCEKIPFAAAGFTSTNVKDAIVEARTFQNDQYKTTSRSAQVSTSQTTFQNYLSLQIEGLTIGAKYRIGCDFQYKGNNNASKIIVGIGYDNTTLREKNYSPLTAVASVYPTLGDYMIGMFVATATTHTIRVKWRSEYNWAQATMIDAILEFWRVA